MTKSIIISATIILLLTFVGTSYFVWKKYNLKPSNNFATNLPIKNKLFVDCAGLASKNTLAGQLQSLVVAQEFKDFNKEIRSVPDIYKKTGNRSLLDSNCKDAYVLFAQGAYCNAKESLEKYSTATIKYPIIFYCNNVDESAVI